MKIVVGLGNPGKEYENTRHNFGSLVVDRLVDELGGSFRKSRRLYEAFLHKEGKSKVLFVKPLTFMNLSGVPVEKALRYYKKKPDVLLVIHDDLDLPLGRIKFTRGGSAGGHKGIESIIELLGTRNFCRLRLGIGRPEGKMESADYVLSEFFKTENDIVGETIEKAVKGVKFYSENGIQAAMDRFNRKD